MRDNSPEKGARILSHAIGWLIWLPFYSNPITISGFEHSELLKKRKS